MAAGQDNARPSRQGPRRQGSGDQVPGQARNEGLRSPTKATKTVKKG